MGRVIAAILKNNGRSPARLDRGKRSSSKPDFSTFSLLGIPAMSRTSVMTIGFLLIFLGIQLNMVESWVLTPQATRFWNERIVDPASDLVTESGDGMPWQQQLASPFQSPYQQASWGSNPAANSPFANAASGAAAKALAHPSWICWPVFFAGTVFFLHGLSMRK